MSRPPKPVRLLKRPMGWGLERSFGRGAGCGERQRTMRAGALMRPSHRPPGLQGRWPQRPHSAPSVANPVQPQLQDEAFSNLNVDLRISRERLRAPNPALAPSSSGASSSSSLTGSPTTFEKSPSTRSIRIEPRPWIA